MSEVETKFQETEDLWRNLQDKHDSYVALLCGDDETKLEEEDEWLDEVQSLFETLQIEVATLKSNEAKEKNSAEQHRAFVARELEQATLNNLLTQISGLFEENSSHDRLLSLSKDVDDQLERCQAAQKGYLTLSPDETLENAIKWNDDNRSRCAALQHRIAGKLKENSESTEKCPELSKNNLRLERMQMPKFDGKLRDYPRFKADFNRQVLPEMRDAQAAAYVLKTCLTGPPAETVRNVDDDIEEMWHRLDDRYGRPTKLADVIIFELKNTKPIYENDAKRLSELVDMVEAGYKDLKRIHFEHEISNSAVISIIEGKLPQSLQIKWAERVNSRVSEVDEKNKFPYLLEFLLEQKRVAEYVSSDLRGSTGTRHAAAHFVSEESPPIFNHEKRSEVNRCLIHRSNSHKTEDCHEFRSMGDEQRVQLLSNSRACWSCLKPFHRSADCYNRTQCGIDGCKKYHHQSLHEADKAGIEFQGNRVMTARIREKEGGSEIGGCLLQLMNIPSSEGSLNVLWDSGATVSLITYQKAAELKLEGKPLDMTVVKVGGKPETVHSCEFVVPLLNSEKQLVEIRAYAIDKISTPVKKLSIPAVTNLFSGVSYKEVERPHGNIDLLIGMDYAGFHPKPIQEAGHLILLKNQFGKCVSGSHPVVKDKTCSLIQTVTIHHVKRVEIEDFYDTEALGTYCQPRCGGCRCGKCSLGGKSCTIKEDLEMKMIEDGLCHNGTQWVASYPWIKDPKDLPDNYCVALATLKSTEKRLKRNETLSVQYHHQIMDMVNRKVARRLSEEEIRRYDGPVHYISHHEVLKPESQSTPCRIVFNSSAKYKGHILNDYWAKGADLINNLLGVLLRFREEEVPIVGDISKMYHAVGLSEQDQHTHRFLWREFDTSRAPDIYVMSAVSFGDKPAGNVATAALRKSAQLFSKKYPDAVEMIVRNSYVDDIIDSVKDEETAHKRIAECDEILSHGSFKVKEWIIPKRKESEGDQEILSDPFTRRENQKVLGTVWNPDGDQFGFKVCLNFSPKIRKRRSGPDLTADDLPSQIPAALTKREILSQVNGMFDPLGLATPITVKAKILMRKFNTEEKLNQLGWDSEIDEDSRMQWVQLFSEFYKLQGWVFPRCSKPPGTKGDPVIIFFSDASERAYGACVYVRYELTDGGFEARLLISKSRLAPVKQLSIVRLELCGALLSSRLKDTIEKEMRICSSKYFFIVDSAVVHAMLKKDTYGYKTFVALRVGEIQSQTESDQWYWIDGKLNVADIITRGDANCDEDTLSQWKNGPSFLKSEENAWPIERNALNSVQIPDLLTQVNLLSLELTIIGEGLIDIQRFSSYLKLLRVTARILNLKEHRPASLSRIGMQPCSTGLEIAKKFWIKLAQKTILDQYEASKFERLGAHKRDGVIYVGERIERNNLMSYDKAETVLLPHSHPFTKLYVEFVHGLSHNGTSTTMAKVRLFAWVPNLRKLARSVVSKCIKCKRLRGIMAQQLMSSLPPQRLSISPAWHVTYLDFFGPMVIRGHVNKRSRGKVYGIIFTCASSRATHLDIAEDYSKEGFYMVLRRFMSLRGCPGKLVSDPGSQLKAASVDLTAASKMLKQEDMEIFSSSNGFEWEFTSADAPWQNGCAEALIKTAKRGIKAAIGEQALSFAELQTVHFEVAALMNERPIGIHPAHPDDEPYLCPNHLLLGRASARTPTGPFVESGSLRQRFSLVQSIVDSFWKRWIREYFPSLIVRPKWHTSRRNVQVDDVVIIQDDNLARGKWRLGKVCDVYPGVDGRVRNVSVHYKNHGEHESEPVYSGKDYTVIKRPVQRLVVLLPADEAKPDADTLPRPGSVSVESGALNHTRE